MNEKTLTDTNLENILKSLEILKTELVAELISVKNEIKRIKEAMSYEIR